MKRNWSAVLGGLVMVLWAAFAASQTVVKADQGKPGNQGAWPVTCVSGCSGGTGGSGGSSVVFIDGGLVATVPARCSPTLLDAGSPWQVTSVGVAAVNVPATSAATRYYLEVCSSTENTGTPLVKCLGNGVSPVIGLTNRGDVLGVSDCHTYAIAGTNQLSCISDTAATAVTSYECIP